MANHDYDLICLGCGPAGEKAATQASYYGHRVAIVERRQHPGGAMVNTGTVPSKALRETALLCSAFHRRPLPGTDFRIDHSLSIARFMARRYLVEQQEHDRIESSFDRHGIEVHRGDGRLLDGNTVEVRPPSGEPLTLRGRYILVATGSSPLRPQNIPFTPGRVVDADGVLELKHLPESMIIVGGGVIGCEYASIFAEIGVAVTLIHPHAAVLPFVDGECRDHLMQALRDEGVRFVLERSVAEVDVAGTTVRVKLDGGDRLEADVLLWAAGRRSNVDGIGLDAAGVTVDERGRIQVDECYRTTAPTVFAAGDVIGFPALASTSMEQGRIAVCRMFDIDFKNALSSMMPIGLYTIPEVSMVGLGAEAAAEAGHDPVVGRALYRDNVRGRMLGDERGIVKCIFDRESRALLGATIVGESAIELIHIAQAAISAGLGIDHFIDACFNYPSLSEMYKYASYSALQAMAKGRAAA